MADPDHPQGTDHPAAPTRARPDPEALDRGFQQAANVVRRLLSHVSELDTADLPVVDGRTVRIVSLSEVEQWLLGCEMRYRAGEIL